jgi:hypothetical protein
MFRCDKEKKIVGFSGVSTLPRYLVVAGERLLVLEAHPFKVNWGIVKSNHHIAELLNLSYKKKDPSRMTLKLKSRKGLEVGQVDPGRVFVLADPQAFEAALRASVASLQARQ